MNERFERAIAAIDAANAADPNTIAVGGVSGPKELVHAEMVTAWVRRLRPDAEEALLLAARAHHLRRWAVPRDTYPPGRAGYLRWRRDLHRRHAAEVAEILRAVGYDDATVERVQAIVTKRNLGSDPDAQALEDALCLVFLETQFGELAARTERAKMIDILRKTAKKMSPEAVALAGELALGPEERSLLAEALS